MDLDEALVRLWDAGFDEISGENTLIPSKKINLAKTVLGISNKNELTKIEFWRTTLNQSNLCFEEIATELDIGIGPGMRKLPKGGLRKLRAFARKRNLGVGYNTKSVSENNVEHDEGEFELPHIGHKETPQLLSYSEVKDIHHCLVEDFINHFDPISPPGVKNESLLQSAVYRQETSFGDVFKYSTPELTCAALTHSIVNNHAFHNGNKRTALVSMLVFLDKNNMIVTCNQNEIFKFILRVAQHGLVSRNSQDFDDREVAKIAQWIWNNSRKIESGDRVVTWRRLEKILKSYDCGIEQVSGNKINIYRQRKLKRYLGLKSEKCSTQVVFPGSGGDVLVPTIKKIRKDLRLDDENGIDSSFFYHKEPQKIDDFINIYRKTLNRLAKL
ncbi:MAG: type II toxin-antitoxin system death-on-curing family toxin [Reichenbachiella sp.]|uniref:type II toxin-antitoxin system death-on-curing family toxin n=1 Tax=Reichenbachiella sp. TaxID=2184521 RepID=UPI0032671CEB